MPEISQLMALRLCLGLLFGLIVFLVFMNGLMRTRFDRLEHMFRVRDARTLREVREDFLVEWKPTTVREARDTIERLQKWVNEQERS